MIETLFPLVVCMKKLVLELQEDEVIDLYLADVAVKNLCEVGFVVALEARAEVTLTFVAEREVTIEHFILAREGAVGIVVIEEALYGILVLRIAVAGALGVREGVFYRGRHIGQVIEGVEFREPFFFG